MKFATSSILIWTAAAAIFATCCVVKTVDTSESILLIASSMNVAILVWYIARAFYSRGRDSFAAGFALTYVVIELLAIADGFDLIATLSHQLDLWIRYLFPDNADPRIWHTRQITTSLYIKIGYCLIGGAISMQLQASIAAAKKQ